MTAGGRVCTPLPPLPGVTASPEVFLKEPRGRECLPNPRGREGQGGAEGGWEQGWGREEEGEEGAPPPALTSAASFSGGNRSPIGH